MCYTLKIIDFALHFPLSFPSLIFKITILITVVMNMHIVWQNKHLQTVTSSTSCYKHLPEHQLLRMNMHVEKQILKEARYLN